MTLSLYTVFHLNLAYSSIEEEQRINVIRSCYRPLLNLARDLDLPFGIEACGYTLEAAAALEPSWLRELRDLVTNGPCELIGSGYAQLIGPLVPAQVNSANLRLGQQTYGRLLGFCPDLALVNEQAYSAGLIQHYLDNGFEALIMEWENPAHSHPEWNSDWRYLPQIALGSSGERMPVIWNQSIAFQKFQRYAHGEIELREYLDYLSGHAADEPRAFSLYGNDVEVFNFRPGRFRTEAVLEEDEWARIRKLFEALLRDARFGLIRPSQALRLLNAPEAGNCLSLESPDQPVPVKKQEKYNISRWAVTGRDDLQINTACWRIYKALQSNENTCDCHWRELCYLWSSDFRTHITEKRWVNYRQRLSDFERKVATKAPEGRKNLAWGASPRSAAKADKPRRGERNGRLTLETPTGRARLNCKRGLAIDALWFNGNSEEPLVGTLPHGYYDDISLGADYYSGHLVLESPGQPKITDLLPVNPTLEESPEHLSISGEIVTDLGPIYKQIRISKTEPRVELRYDIDWKCKPVGSLRLGHLTLNPNAFSRDCLFYRTHNGGYKPETFRLGKTRTDHGRAVSFLVSAAHAVGMTEGTLEIGDCDHSLTLQVDKSSAAGIGMVTYREVGATYFCRVALSVLELDETSRPSPDPFRLTCRLAILRKP